MIRSTILLFIFFSLLPPVLYSQEKEILMTIGGHKISLDEFENIYKKNNNSGLAEKQSVEDYLKLFINFKLKVIEAENLGLDTSLSFKNELNGYIRQLAKPYLKDSTSFEKLLFEAYNRMKKEIHARHIMIRLDEKAPPEDTLKAYNKLLDIRQRFLNGEDFTTLAKSFSEDPSVVNNAGDLGWFSVFRMVYPFESVAYQTPVNQISLPVRTGYGYHLIEVREVRESFPRLHVAHIFIRAPETMNVEEAADAKNKILSIFNKLQKGENFEKLAMEESDDKATGVKGGELPWFSSGEMIPVFENAAYSIKEIGKYSVPVQSFYGWHIIKLLGRKEIGSFGEERPELVQRINNGDRAALKQQVFIEKLKNDYHYKFIPENFQKIYTLVDTGIFQGKWNDSISLTYKDVIFTIGEKSVNLADFVKYLAEQQRIIQPYNMNVFLNDQFKLFSESRILDYEQEMLAIKHPEFANTVEEYHDGILLFNLMDKMVWSKAVEDTTGLENFFRQNRKKYMWGERLEAYVISSKDKNVIEQARILTSKNGRKKNFTVNFLKTRLCPDDTTGNCLSIIYGKFEKGGNKDVDQTNWVEGIGDTFTKDDLSGFVFVKRKIASEEKKFNEVKGLITSDYQTYLEDEWIRYLHKKYPVEGNFELLKKIN